MVHFHKRLLKNRRAKWVAHYLQYKRLKNILKAANTLPWFLRRNCCDLWKHLFSKACDAEENALPLLASTDQTEGDTALIQHQKEKIQEFEEVIRKDFRLVQEFYSDQFELLRAEYRSMLRYVRRRESFQNVMDLDPDQLFEEVAHLRDFGTLNGTGFYKILKNKYLHQVGDTRSHEDLDFDDFAPVYRSI
eukprot:gene20798-24929_t